MLDMVLAATLGAAGMVADLPCSDADAAHVAANFRVCAWEPSPPLQNSSGSSDYRGRGFIAPPLSRPIFEWQLRDREVLPLNEIPRSTLNSEKDTFGGYVAACAAPEAVSRLGADEAGRRGDQAMDCWQFLDEEEIRRGGGE